MNQKELKNELMSLVNENSQIEIEKVERYLNLVSIFRDLDKSLKEHGFMLETINASQVFLKVNPAIGEKVKVNQALIKLGDFFDKRRDKLADDSNNPSFSKPEDFL